MQIFFAIESSKKSPSLDKQGRILFNGCQWIGSSRSEISSSNLWTIGPPRCIRFLLCVLPQNRMARWPTWPCFQVPLLWYAESFPRNSSCFMWLTKCDSSMFNVWNTLLSDCSKLYLYALASFLGVNLCSAVFFGQCDGDLKRLGSRKLTAVCVRLRRLLILLHVRFGAVFRLPRSYAARYGVLRTLVL